MDDINQQILNLLNAITKTDLDLTPILPAIKERIESSIEGNIIQGGRWNGNIGNIGIFSGGSSKWTPLAASTVKGYRKRGIGNSNPTLNRSAGGLQSTRSVLIVGKSAISIGYRRAYAQILNEGGDFVSSVQVGSHNRKISQSFGKLLKKPVNIKIGSFTRKQHTKIPARPYIVLQEDDLEFIRDLIADYVVSQGI